jgi:hypothetical protein
MFKAEPDDEFPGQWIVCELSEDPDRNGTVVGYAVRTGDDTAGDIAEEAVQYLNEHGHQPEGIDGYTVAHGEEF